MQKLNLLALVTLAATNPNAVEMIQERLRAAKQGKDWRAVQQCKLALQHALKRVQG